MLRLATVLLALSGIAAPALASEGRIRSVNIPAKAYAPGRMEVLVGDTVTWANADAIDHTVTADASAFDSGYLSPGTTFSVTFPKRGRFQYHCTIHRFMRGEVIVVPVSLQGPGMEIQISSGEKVMLHGIAPVGATRVSLVRLGARGRIETRATPAADGSFTVSLRVFRPGAYSARIGSLSSSTVHLHVSPLVHVRRTGATVHVRVGPSRPHARIALQRYIRELFAWRTVGHAQLDASSRTTVSLPGNGRFRVVVRGTHGWADAASASIVVSG